ncbi:ABC transporter substrate-binding protein [Acidisphaera sp. L21]|uniref:ABC transporter substrate-binding protein n=1 Tax=Acidisphaera sp. L21 TaxID=1641851 RepID=UPI00131C2C75|nr:ABC transporter substrate-binding protein [Acidisphaera sp. L21]
MRRLVLAFLLLAGPVSAQNLRIGVAALATSADPQFYNLAANNSLANHIFGRLTQRGPDGTLQPDLALNWTPVGDTAWDFHLRPGVMWQDGTPFTADDVAFSFTRAPNVPNSPSNFAGMLRAVTKMEAIDPLTIRLHTARPAPNLPGDLAIVSIISRHAGENAATDAYDSNRAAIGTGPYKLEQFVRGDRVVLVRNESYWGPHATWAHVTLRLIANPAARSAALLAGDVDAIDAIPASDLPGLRSDRRVSVWEAPGLRVMYLAPDFTREGSDPDITGNDGKPLPTNPLRDLRVRQALSLAIDRKALVTRVMVDAATATGQWLPTGLPGSLPDHAVPAYDPAAARHLLAEAGYPDGFHLVFHAPTDRYINGPAVAQAVAGMWTRIGVQTQLDMMPGALYGPRGVKHGFAMGEWSWSNGTAEAGYALVNVLGTQNGTDRGVSNVNGYGNAKLDALTDQALATIDADQRNALLRQAMTIAVDELGDIPLFHYKNAWATRAGLKFEARSDDLTMATSVTPAPSP